MSTYVKLTVCRRLDNRLEGQDDKSARAVELHLLRSRALHDILDEDPAWEVSNWGYTDDEQPHEWVQLWIKLQEAAAALAPVAVPALLYVGKVLLDKGIETVVVDGVKRLLAKIRKRQEEGQIRDGEVTFTDETTISCHPEAGLTIKLRTSVSIPYDAARDQINGLETGTETINVPAALAPLVRRLIADNAAAPK
jgi:hypothetical protein